MKSRSLKFSHPVFGTIHIYHHPSSRRISARWINDNTLKIICPRLVSDKDIEAFLKRYEKEILSNRPKQLEWHDIVLEDWQLKVFSDKIMHDKIQMRIKLPECHIIIGEKLWVSQSKYNALFNRAVLTIASNIASHIIIPQAIETANRLGVNPKEWKISRGKKVLGFCNSKKEISLSYMIIFLPRYLREYVICHELAHLTEMNHSANFHTLCDSYLNGCEKKLIKELKSYKWPVQR